MKYKLVRDRCSQNKKCQDYRKFSKGSIIRHSKAGVSPSYPPIIEEEDKFVDKIIDHFKLTFMAERPPPQSVQQELLMAAEERGDYF